MGTPFICCPRQRARKQKHTSQKKELEPKQSSANNSIELKSTYTYEKEALRYTTNKVQTTEMTEIYVTS